MFSVSSSSRPAGASRSYSTTCGTPHHAGVGIIYGASVVVVGAGQLDDTAELDGAGVAGTTGCDGAVAGADGRELTTLDCRYTSHPTTVPTGAS
jgi:hypothetical protein